MRTPLVTIGIPTYNRADSYLRDALQSARAQTYPNLEIVVTDNGSTDGTRDYVASFDDARIRYVRHEPALTPNENFNSSLERARGEFFLLLHDDDQIDPDFVESCISAADGSGDVGVIRTGSRVVNDRGHVISHEINRPTGSDLADLFLSWFRGETSIYFCNTLFNTEALRGIGGFGSPHDLVQDNAALARLAASHGWIDIPAAKASFRRHSRKMAQAADVSHWCEDSLWLLDLMCDLVAPDRADRVRRDGLAFFTRQNYRRISRAPTTRLSHYWRIYRAFGYRYGPWTYFFEVIVFEWLQAARDRLRQSAAYDPSEASGDRASETP